LAHIERRLAVCPRLRATDLHHELQSGYRYAGSYPTFRRQLLPLRLPLVVEPEVGLGLDPGCRLEADHWKALGTWPLGEELVELHAMVAVLGHSRQPAIRMATCRTREVSFERLVRCLDVSLRDLGDNHAAWS
jgi:hypothetical protein